jgi:MinD-like ATPase involved in chromosome partitioning or flagellar assembly
MICVLVVASGSSWEPRALEVISSDRELVLIKRCVDIADLLAAATAGQADAALVSLDLPGFDASATDLLRRHRVHSVGIVGPGGGALDQHRLRGSRIGVSAVLDQAEIDSLPSLLAELALDADGDVDPPPVATPGTAGDLPLGATVAPGRPGRVIVVWGPAGSPGRTTVACGLAAVLAERGRRTTLVDADPYGGSVAPTLGILDEVSGILSAARLVSSGLIEERLSTAQRALSPHLTVVTWTGDRGVGARQGLRDVRPSRAVWRRSWRSADGVRRWSMPIPTAVPSHRPWASSTRSAASCRPPGWCRRGLIEERLSTAQRALSPHLTVVTGLPRPDRWIEVRTGAVETLAEELRRHGDVVIDTGFSLEEDPGSDFGSRPGRNTMSRGAIEVADEVVVVGAADPVGLARLARALVELRDTRADAPVRVVVNRMRGSLGWPERDIAGMVEGFARVESITFVPDDQPGADRALAGGRLLTESGESKLLAGLRELAERFVPDQSAGPKRRRAGRALRP